MPEFLIEHLTEIAVGLGSALLGVIAGLGLPFVRWKIEKWSDIRADRRLKINQWRAAIAALDDFSEDSLLDFGDSEAYSTLRPHLAKKVRNNFEKAGLIIVSGGRGQRSRKQMLFDEVARLERKWGLV